MTSSRFFTFFCALALVAFVGCGDREPADMDVDDDVMVDDDAMGSGTILTVAEDAELTTFRTAVLQAGLDQTLGGPGPYTVFAPSDDAFDALPEGTLASLMEEGNRDQLADILTYHVLARSAMSGELSGELTLNSVEGQPLTINATDGAVTVTDAMGNTANVVTADLDAPNGIIHVIDRVLMPAESEMMEEDM